MIILKTTVVREINSQGRLQLSKDFCDYAGIEKNSLVVISKGKNDNELYIIAISKVHDFEKVIAFSKVDDKFRIIIPNEIRDNDERFEISVNKNGVIIRA